MREGWEIKKLGEVCEILDKQRKPITKKNRIEGEYPYYGATGILSYVHEYIFDEKLVLIGEDGAKWESGDNSSFIVDGKYWVNNHAHVIRPIRDIILDKLIVNFLNFSDLTEYITGTTVPKLNQEKMRSIPIPLPPLPEQKHIVAILDKVFATIAKAKANAEQNLKNAKELFESYLQGVFENRGEDWEEKRLGEIAKYKRGLTYSKKDEADFSDNVVLRATNISLEDNKIDLNELKYLKEEIQIKEDYKLIKNSLLICLSSGSKKHLGKVALVDKDYSYAFGGFIGQIEPDENTYPQYLFYCLISDTYKKYISELSDGVNINNLKSKDLLAYQIPLSSLQTQQNIVQKLDAISTETKKLEAVYQQRIEDLEELKKSVLQKAFAGELNTENELAV